MSWRRILFAFFIIIVAGISGLSGAVAGGWAVYRAISNQPAISISPLEPLQPSPTPTEDPGLLLDFDTTQVETSVAKAVQKVGPAVVTVVGTLPGQMTFFGPTGEQTVSGSGVFISNDGYVLTNNHVVEGLQSSQLSFPTAAVRQPSWLAAIAIRMSPCSRPSRSAPGDSRVWQLGHAYAWRDGDRDRLPAR